MIPLLVLAGLAYLVTRKSGGAHAAPLGALFTFGVFQMVKGKSYHFETEMGGMDPSQAQGVLSGLQAAGAWDIYVAPTTPLLVNYSQRCLATQALSVGVPYPVEGGTTQAPRTFTCKTVREVPVPAHQLAA
jgi:hypothetical protein